MKARSAAIIGGGPAGFIAAISLAENNSAKEFTIDIFDKKEPLTKLLLTGGGRCNITNATYDHKELASNYPRGEKFLYSVFKKFGVKETIGWFDRHGAKLYTQEDKRVFPKSNDANTVRNLLMNEAKRLKINIKAHTPVIKTEYSDNKFLLNIHNSILKYDKIIISTGGNSKNISNSGYNLAKSLGHKVTELRQSLTAFIVKEKWTSELAGVSVKEAEITAFFENKQTAKVSGDFIFTHNGVSGPAVFKISSYCAFLDYDRLNPIILKINFIPQKKADEVEKELLKEFEENSKKSIINILNKYAPKSVIMMLLSLQSMNPEKKASRITREERKNIVKLLTSTKLTVKSPEPDGEIVTAGGVDLNEINSKTMESKLVKGLYFCGEVLNIDGFTDGFNLQACWSTGYIAGLSQFII